MLTSERCNGIKPGYWSPAKKDDLIQKLGRIEAEGPRLINETCDLLCHMQVNAAECADCPLKRLYKVIREGGTK